jgi:hypothetical protein
MSNCEPQSFPKIGLLSKNLNLTTSQLMKQIGKTREAAYSYIVATVKWDATNHGFEQRGSAPNFQGGSLTLCTCKHQMRSSLDVSDWPHKWLAGFTSRSLHEEVHWLFFLTRITDAHDSHFDLWRALPSAIRNAKTAEEHFLGDLFVPRRGVEREGRFDPRNYVPPPKHSHHRHSCDNGWHNDIRYRHSKRFGRPPSLLVGDPQFTFLWEQPVVAFVEHHCRNFKKWGSVTELLQHLKTVSR